MSPIVTLRLEAREVAALRTALRPGPSGPAVAGQLGRAAVAAQLLWRARVGDLSRLP
jgi:hypothetical protein